MFKGQVKGKLVWAGAHVVDAQEFIYTLNNPRLQERLERAIHGRGAFRAFKDTLGGFPKERERWFQFKDERARQRVLDWLEEERIELVEEG